MSKEKLISKETPMKPTNQVVIDWGLGNAGDCPLCLLDVNYQQKYCSYCGQKLDWSENNE